MNEAYSVLNFFKLFKRINTVIAIPDRIFVYDYFEQSVISVYPTSNSDEVFLDKLRNLKRYNFIVHATIQKPRLSLIDGKFQGVDVFFMKTIAQKINATFSIELYDKKNWNQNKIMN